MRYIAVAAGQSRAFTVEGSIAVSLLGALTGAVVAALFLLVRVILPHHGWIRAAVFWAICGALALRGIRPVTPLKAAIFLPLFVLHGALLHAFWYRTHR